MVIKQSTELSNFPIPSSAFRLLANDSNEKGIVKIAIVEAQDSLATRATTGAAPVPVPPPRPPVNITRSAPSTAFLIS